MLYELILITATGAITPIATYPTEPVCWQAAEKISIQPPITITCRPTLDKAQQRAELDHGLNTIFYVLTVGKKFIDSQHDTKQSLDR